MFNKRGFAPIFIIVIVAIAIALAGGTFYYIKNIKPRGQIACTMEAKQCPDGSYVGRTGPSCEFAQCPATSTQDVSGWKTYTNNQYGFEFKYPSDWETPVEKNGRISIGTANPDNYEGEKLRISVIDKNYKTLDQIISSEGSQKGISFSGIKKTTLNGAEARSFIEQREGGFLAFDLYATHGNYIYEVLYGNRAFSDPIPKTVSQVDQILPTFKFINSDATGQHCGGFIQNAPTCPVGYVCKLNKIADTGGTCAKTIDVKTNGILAGRVTIGPNCPVERVGVPCPPSPEAYAAREFLVLNSDQKQVASFHADASGNFSLSLPPDTYTVVSAKTGIGYMSKDLPQTVIIKANQTTTLNIDVDTGIR